MSASVTPKWRLLIVILDPLPALTPPAVLRPPALLAPPASWNLSCDQTPSGFPLWTNGNSKEKRSVLVGRDFPWIVIVVINSGFVHFLERTTGRSWFNSWELWVDLLVRSHSRRDLISFSLFLILRCLFHTCSWESDHSPNPSFIPPSLAFETQPHGPEECALWEGCLVPFRSWRMPHVLFEKTNSELKISYCAIYPWAEGSTRISNPSTSWRPSESTSNVWAS